MSATVPESAREYYEVDSPIVDADAAEARAKTPPLRKVKFGGSVAVPEDCEKILKEMLQRKCGIIYANTVARAMAYRTFLKKLQNEIDPEFETEIILYHSRFTEPHKKGKEKKLEELLGPDAWKNKRPNAIAILTQIGEMSINISTDLMLSEACPWDRLSQRLGRLNRFHESEEGVCIVIEPLKDEELYPAPYGEYVKNVGWLPSKPLSETVDHIREIGNDSGSYVTPIEMTGYVNKLYSTIEEFSPAARQNLRDYEKVVRESVIVLPNTKTDDDNGEIYSWNARQIGPQVTILTRAIAQCKNWSDWQTHVLLYGLSVPLYQIEKDNRLPEDQRKLTKCVVKIGYRDEPDQEEYYYARSEDDESLVAYGGEVYNSELGLFGLYNVCTKKGGSNKDDGC